MSEERKMKEVNFTLREYDGKTFLKMKSRIFKNKNKTSNKEDKNPDYKTGGHAAAWYAQGDNWKAIDIQLEPLLDDVIEFLENNGFTVGKSK